MKIEHVLYYSWNEITSIDIQLAFIYQNIRCHKIEIPLQNYDEDASFEGHLMAALEKDSYDCIFSFNYFPIISRVAEQYKIPYISWVYDCPHTTLFSDTVRYSMNYIFIFDRMMCEEVRKLGGKHVYHMPLAVNTKRLQKVCMDAVGITGDKHSEGYDVSFVGSLYDDILYDKINYLPDYLRGFLDGMIQTQQSVWGMNFTSELLTSEVVNEMDQYIKLGDQKGYHFSHQQIYADILNKKITQQERIVLLNWIAEYFPLDLFTESNPELCPNGNVHGFISYTEQMPVVFANSKINLNISLRSITSGIPLRCLDILGAGGFLLTNYQPEMFEYFTEGEDFVCYEGKKDLLEKIEYYLNQEEERKKIAQNGYEKVVEYFNYEKKIQQIMTILR